MSDVATIRATATRLRAEGIPVAEYALRRWVKTGLVPSIPCGQKKLLFYPAVKAFICGGGVGRGDNDAKNR